jgi:hypothetical protein
MSRTLEVPDELYERLERQAAIFGKTPLEWLDMHLPSLEYLNRVMDGRPLIEKLEGLIGNVASGGIENMKEDPNDPFFNYLLQKKREGRL